MFATGPAVLGSGTGAWGFSAWVGEVEIEI